MEWSSGERKEKVKNILHLERPYYIILYVKKRGRIKLCYGRVTVSGMQGYQLNIKFFQAIDKDMPGDF